MQLRCNEIINNRVRNLPFELQQSNHSFYRIFQGVLREF